MNSIIRKLELWYQAKCNGDWEHSYGIQIETLDNPGWCLKIDLEDTSLLNAEFTGKKYQNTDEGDWIDCKKEGSKYVAFGGPCKLEELIAVFLDWADSCNHE